MTVYDFLKEHKMLSSSFDREKLERAFKEDMKTKNTLFMTNSFQTCKKGVKLSGEVLTIDMGGTNLRYSLYRDGALISTKKKPMMGVGDAVSADYFFEELAKDISEFEPTEIGFCFSYPCDVQKNKDAVILRFDKEVKVDGAVGKLLGEEINKRLEKKRKFSILNDTVAAQLGSETDAGIILGTGYNICYTDLKSGTIIDSECGQYQLWPQGDYDNKFDEVYHINHMSAEKQISGAYIGKLIRLIAIDYLGKDLPDFDLPEISDLLKDEGKLVSMLSAYDINVIKEIARYIIERGASIVASMIKCLMEGYESASIALEGTTVYKTPGYLDELKKQIKEIVPFEVDIVDGRGKIEIGCARSLL